MSAEPADRIESYGGYKAASVAMLRVPLLPVERYLRLHTDEAGASPHRLDGAIRLELNDDIVRDALAAMTGPNDIERQFTYGSEAKRQRARRTLLRYLTRLSTRCTPLGMSAGVAIVTFGDATRINLAPPHHHRTKTRPDIGWLLDCLGDKTRVPDLECTPNAYLIEYGERIWNTAKGGRSASIRATEPVRRALDIARSGATMDELVATLVHESENAPTSKVAEFIQELIENGFLIPRHLRLQMTSADPTEALVDQLEAHPEFKPLRQEVELLRALAERIDRTPLGRREKFLRLSWKSLAKANGEVRQRHSLQIDMATQLTQSKLSAQVADEFESAADLLLRLSDPDRQFPHLRSYRDAFVSRYGQREIRLLKALEPDLGLGPPDTYLHPPSSRQRTLAQPSENARAHRLHEIAFQALADGFGEHVLTQSDIEVLEADFDHRLPALPSIDVFGTVVAKSQAAIDEGDFQIVVEGCVADAGRSFGRFMSILGSAEAMQMFASGLADHRMLTVDLTYMGEPDRLGNVMITPTRSSHEITLNAEPSNANSERVSLSEIVVGVDELGLYLRSTTENRLLYVHANHMVAPHHAPNVCRFMCEVSQARFRNVHAFSWASASGLPFLPRIRIGRQVLSLARWLMPSTLIRAASGDNSTKWPESLDTWRSTFHVPRYITVVKGDNRLVLDLTSPSAREDLRQEARRCARSGERLSLEEMFPTFDGVWCEGSAGERYAAQLVVPLRRPSPLDIAHTGVQDRRTAGRWEPHVWLRPPGTEWLFLKVYGPRALQDDLLRDHVAEWNQIVRGSGDSTVSWFFIRYADPEPHIRLRYCSDPSQLLCALGLLADPLERALSKDVATSIEIATYERETKRYGGPMALPSCEEIFWHSSELALAASEARLTADARLLLAILSVNVLTAQVAPNLDERYATIAQLRGRRISRTDNYVYAREFRDHSRDITNLLVASNSEIYTGLLAAQIASFTDAVERSFGHLHRLRHSASLERPVTEILADLIHVHCNRIVGTQRDSEDRIIVFLERGLQAARHMLRDQDRPAT